MLFVRNPQIITTTLNQGVPGWRMPRREPRRGPPRPLPRG